MALSDSMLIVQQVRGEYETKGESMTKYLEVIRRLLYEFTTWVIDKIPREENVEADRLSKFASIIMPEPNPEEKKKKVLVEYLPQRSTEEEKMEVLETRLEVPKPCWMDPILAYLKDGALSADRRKQGESCIRLQITP